MRVDVGEDRLGQPVSLQKGPEVQDRGLIRDAVVAQFDPGKAPHRLAVIKGLLGHRVAQGTPVLQEIHPQHHLQRPETGFRHR